MCAALGFCCGPCQFFLPSADGKVVFTPLWKLHQKPGSEIASYLSERTQWNPMETIKSKWGSLSIVGVTDPTVTSFFFSYEQKYRKRDSSVNIFFFFNSGGYEKNTRGGVCSWNLCIEPINVLKQPCSKSCRGNTVKEAERWENVK